MKKTKKILLWGILVIYLIVMLIVVKRKYSSVECSKIEVSITNSEYNKFLEQKDVMSLLNKKKIVGQKITKINTDNIEKMLQQHPHIKNANVYRNMKGVLKVEIKQRTAIARVINKTQIGFYIDNEGFIMPLSNKYSPYVLIINGNIDEAYNKWNNINLSHKNDTIKSSIMFDLYSLVNHINGNKFWKAQIEQIYVDNNEFELIPRVGNQVIIFGTAENHKTKLRNLKALYTNGMEQVGWNKYSKINLKYNNQIICTKR